MILKPLFDCDISIFKSLWFGKGDFLKSVESCDEFLDFVISKFPGNPRLFLSGDNNFRRDLYPEYKANRKDKPKPRYFWDLREYLYNFRNAEVINGMEADDAIGMAVSDDTIVVSGDKDMHQLPGIHFDIKNNTTYEITEYEAAYNFWKQVITGDKTDNIPGLGVYGYGETSSKPGKLLGGLDKQDLRPCVESLYKEHYGEGWYERMDLMCRLLFLLRKPNAQYYEYF